MKYILCNSIFLDGQILRVAKEIDDEKFDVPKILAEGGVLIALPNTVIEERARRVREQQGAGRWDEDNVSMLAAHAEEGGGGGGVPATRRIDAGAGLSGGGDLSADRIISLAFDDTAHGDRGGGSLHDLVTQTTNGFMSFLDKIKVDNTPAGNVLVFRQGGVSGLGVVATWAEVAAFSAAQQTPWDLFIDSTITTCEVPAATDTDLRNLCTIKAFAGSPTGLVIKDTGVIRNPRGGLGGNINTEAITMAGVIFDIPGNVADFRDGSNIQNIPGVSLVPGIDVIVPSMVFASLNAGYIQSNEPGVGMINYTQVGGFFILAALTNSAGGATNYGDNCLVADATSTLFSIGDTTTRLGPQALFLGTIVNNQIGVSDNLNWNGGNLASRPTYALPGHTRYDTDIQRQIVFDGVGWTASEKMFKLTFQDGGSQAPGRVTTWSEVITFAAAQTSPWELIFDGTCEVPAGTGVDFNALCMWRALPNASVTIRDTGTVTNVKGVTGALFVSCEAQTQYAFRFTQDYTFYLSGLSFIESAAGSLVPAVQVDTQYLTIEASDGSYFYTSGFTTIFNFPVPAGDHYFLFKDFFQPGSNSPVPVNSIDAEATSFVSCIHDGSAQLGAQAGVTTLANYAVDKAMNIEYVPSTPANWAGSPTTIQEALDRIAAVVSVGGGTPIP